MIPGAADTDEATVLLDRARAGDDLALASLYRNVAPSARRAAQRIVYDPYTADDLVQEAFYLILRAVRSGLGPKDSFRGYVIATVKRLAYRYLSTQSRHVLTEDHLVWERPDGPASSAQADLAAAAWASLPRRWRSVLWLIEVDRYSPAELAPWMAMTPNAVSSLAARARHALRLAYVAQQRMN